MGPLSPYLPAGATLRMTLKNVGNLPVVSLAATMRFGPPQNGPGVAVVNHTFGFDVTSSKPLLSHQSVSVTEILIGVGFDSEASYPLTINATLQNGTKFLYTELVQIALPE